MNILVTNDDGVFAPGIKYLVHELENAGYNVVVFAPHRECSGKSHSITLKEKIIVKGEAIVGVKGKVYSVTGTPTDCVRIAKEILNEDFDLVVSGCNFGLNAGMDIHYSGTVSAAMEANLFGKSAIAISALVNKGEVIFETAVKSCVDVLQKYEDYLLKNVTVFNINAPCVKYEDLKGIKFCKAAKSALDNYSITFSDEGTEIILKGRKIIEHEEDTDRYYLQEGYATVTPLIYDLSDEKIIDEINKK